MIKILLAVTAVFIFNGCTQPLVPQKNSKHFEGEDRYVLFALEAERVHDFKSSASLFYTTYEKTKKSEYFYRSLQGLYEAHEYSQLLKNVQQAKDENLNKNNLKRYEILALIGLEKLQDAQKEALLLAERTKESPDILLVSDIYVKEKLLDQAAQYLQHAYNSKHDEDLLINLATLLYADLNKKEEAKKLLEAYIQNYGCSKPVCMKLAAIYGSEENADEMVKIYRRLYNTAPSDELAGDIIKLYGYQKDYSRLMLFLESCHCNDELLLQLYVDAKLFSKAAPLAKKIYESSFETKYLAQSAIYMYENAGEKIDKKTIEIVVHDLQEAIEKDPQDIYLNYLGYLLIDKDIDPARGIEYVKEALKIQSDSAYFLDSLAWGYYKQHRCQEAKTLMDKVVEKVGLEEPEIKEHLQAINKCIKEGHK
jgi:hypothetical protein